MLKVNLEKKLVSANEAEKTKNAQIIEDSGLNEIKGLLENNSSRDREILDCLGANSINSLINEVHSNKIELEKAEDYFGGRVFLEKEIKDLAITYRLKFLPSENFIGNFDIEVLAKIKALEKQITVSRTKDQASKKQLSVEEYVAQEGEVKFTFDRHELKKNFFVMAPGAMFNLTVKPKPEKIRQVRDWDPVLFYKGEDGKYVMVHKWGKDFTIFRAIKGYVMKNENTLFFTLCLIISSILFLSLSSFTNIFINSKVVYNIFAILGVFLVTPIVAILLIPSSTSDTYSEVGWNTPFKS